MILGQPFLRELGGIWECLWPFRTREEPLVLRDLTYWLSFQLHGEWAPGFKVVDLAFHAGTTLLVWRLGRRVLGLWEPLSPRGVELAALAAAFLFAVHPIHVESVAWLSGRKDVMSGVFYLAGACTWLDYLGSPEPGARRRSYVLTGLLYLGALGSKAGCVSFPLVLFAADLLLGPRRPLWKRALAVLPFVLLTVAYIKAYTGMLRDFDAMKGTSVLEAYPEPLTLVLTNSAVMEQYLWRMVLPLDQRVFSSQTYRLEATPEVLRAGAVCLAVLGASLWIGWRHRALGFLLAWIPLALAPFLNIAPSGIKYAERYTYLSSVAVYLLVGAGLVLLCSKAGRRRRLALALALAALVIPASIRSSQLARAFENDGTVWSLVLEQEPENYIALGNLANWYGKDLEPPPERGPIPADFATRVAPVRDAARAEETYRRLIELRPTRRNARRLGRLFERRGRLDEALAEFKRALGPDPAHGEPFAWLALARVYTKLSARRAHAPLSPGAPPLYDKALRIFDLVERSFPAHAAQASFQRAQTLEFLGQRAEAIKAWEACLAAYASSQGPALAEEGRAALERLRE